jgi:hypothetical protein
MSLSNIQNVKIQTSVECLQKNSSFANFGRALACAICKCAVLWVGFLFKNFKHNYMVVDAVVRNFEIIGEAP